MPALVISFARELSHAHAAIGGERCFILGGGGGGGEGLWWGGGGGGGGGGGLIHNGILTSHQNFRGLNKK